MNDAPEKAPHILNASTNLIGFSFIVLTSLKVLGLGQNNIIDEITAIAVTSFMVSTFFSFLSIRTRNVETSNMFETIADYIFLGGVLLLFIVCVSLTIK